MTYQITTTPSQADRAIRCSLDGTVTAIGGQWLSLMQPHECNIIRQHQVGMSLFSSVDPPEYRHLLRVLINRVLETGKDLAFPVRCWQGNMFREFRLHLSPSPPDGVAIENELVKEVELGEDLGVIPEDPLVLRMCSWCKKVLTTQGWAYLEVALEEAELFCQREVPRISHGVCPSCRDEMTAKVAAKPASKPFLVQR